MTTGLDLAAIEGRLNAATGDYWEWDSYSQILALVEPDHPLAFQDDDCEPSVAVVAIVCGGEVQIGRGDELVAQAARDNAEFIARAPTDVASLLAEVRQLRAVADAARGFVRLIDDFGIDSDDPSLDDSYDALVRALDALDGDAAPVASEATQAPNVARGE